MTPKEAVAKWSEAATVSNPGKGLFVRDGNWQPLSRALRHFDGDTTIEEQKDTLNGDTVVLVTPAEKTAEGKMPMNRTPFLLLVR